MMKHLLGKQEPQAPVVQTIEEAATAGADAMFAIIAERDELRNTNQAMWSEICGLRASDQELRIQIERLSQERDNLIRERTMFQAEMTMVSNTITAAFTRVAHHMAEAKRQAAEQMMQQREAATVEMTDLAEGLEIPAEERVEIEKIAAQLAPAKRNGNGRHAVPA